LVPIPVDVVVSVRRSASAGAQQIVTSTVLLRRVGEEITVFRFKLDDNGQLVADSVHKIFKPLRVEKG